jgi:hypothetical protein
MGKWAKIGHFFANLLFWLGFGLCALVVLTGWYLWPQRIDVDPYRCLPRPEFVHGRLTLPYTDRYPMAEILSSENELRAALYFQFLRARTSPDGIRIWFAVARTPRGPLYQIILVGQGDLLTDIPRLGGLESRRLIPRSEYTLWSWPEYSRTEEQSQVFEAAYNRIPAGKLEALEPEKLESRLASFLLFKSETDIRVLQDMEPMPKPLTWAQAKETAADIITVARFYDLPLEYFVAVGAVENDYMDVNGDLTHTVWKKRAQSGDIILLHRRKRVLVSDFSVGAWQITRETLRAAHRLYLADRRDYSVLPERLRPPLELDLNAVGGPVLTTYAGLLLRELLDYFRGDVQKAVGAYNGGIKTPNPDYAAAVARVAEYASRMIEDGPVFEPGGGQPAMANPTADPDRRSSVRPWQIHDP